MSKGNVYALVDMTAISAPIKFFTIAQWPSDACRRGLSEMALCMSPRRSHSGFDEIEQRLANPPKPVIVTDRFPHETHHGWKFIAFGPDGKLYVPVGAPCTYL